MSTPERPLRRRDLGPLEHSMVAALIAAEPLRLALTPAMWLRQLGYASTLPNLRASLSAGQPLRSLVTERRGAYVLRDRAPWLGEQAGRQRRADRWLLDAVPRLIGLGKLPWVEAVALAGSVAWGLWPTEGQPQIVVIAEGGRRDLAARAVGFFLSLRFGADDQPLVEVLDGDALVPPTPSAPASAYWASLRPVVNAEAFAWVWSQLPGATAHFPQGGPGHLHGLAEIPTAQRIDGRIAAVRRAIVAPAGGSPILGRSQRQRSWLTSAEDASPRTSHTRWFESLPPPAPVSLRLAGLFEVEPAGKGPRSADGPAAKPAVSPTPARAEGLGSAAGSADRRAGLSVDAVTAAPPATTASPAPQRPQDAVTTADGPRRESNRGRRRGATAPRLRRATTAAAPEQRRGTRRRRQ